MAFVRKLINGKLSCQEFLMKINFKILTFDSRNNRHFLVPQCSTNLIKHSPEYRLLGSCNNNVPDFDFSFDSQLKNMILNMNIS